MTLVDGIGCWTDAPAATTTATTADAGRGALFLDRDGVVVREVEFLRRPEDVELMPGVAELIADRNAQGIPVVVVTNQSGVARELLTWADFERVQEAVGDALARAGARVDATYACGYHAAGEGPLGVVAHPWRKPNPGMLQAAAQALGVDLSASWMVGDRASDLEAAAAAGLAGGVHVMTGHATPAHRAAAQALRSDRFRVECADDLVHAGRVLKGRPGAASASR